MDLRALNNSFTWILVVHKGPQWSPNTLGWCTCNSQSASTSGAKEIHSKGTRRKRSWVDNTTFSSVKLDWAVVPQCIGCSYFHICWTLRFIWSSRYPYSLQFKSEFGNKEFMIWATVSSQSCFCWLYRASPSLATKNIINLISVLTIWWCPCVESSLVFLKQGVCYDSAFSWKNSISLCPASFYPPGPNLPVTPGVSWLPTLHSSPL